MFNLNMLGLAVFVALSITVIASCVPAVLAARLDPAETLREE
jgi:ABC-type antimicrobial peptide transport system permease subunit